MKSELYNSDKNALSINLFYLKCLRLILDSYAAINYKLTVLYIQKQSIYLFDCSKMIGTSIWRLEIIYINDIYIYEPTQIIFKIFRLDLLHKTIKNKNRFQNR